MFSKALPPLDTEEKRTSDGPSVPSRATICRLLIIPSNHVITTTGCRPTLLCHWSGLAAALDKYVAHLKEIKSRSFAVVFQMGTVVVAKGKEWKGFSALTGKKHPFYRNSRPSNQLAINQLNWEALMEMYADSPGIRCTINQAYQTLMDDSQNMDGAGVQMKNVSRVDNLYVGTNDDDAGVNGVHSVHTLTNLFWNRNDVQEEEARNALSSMRAVDYSAPLPFAFILTTNEIVYTHMGEYFGAPPTSTSTSSLTAKRQKIQ